MSVLLTSGMTPPAADPIGARMSVSRETQLADLLLADIANARALVRLNERGRWLVRCRKCWLGFVLPTTKKERHGVIRKAIKHYRTHNAKAESAS